MSRWEVAQRADQRPKLPPVKPLTPEWTLLRFLKPWKAEHLKAAAEKGVDLAALLAQQIRKSRLLRWLVGLARDKYAYLREHWTPENVLIWLADRRPDLYRAVSVDKDLLAWFTENMNRLREYLWGPDGAPQEQAPEQVPQEGGEGEGAREPEANTCGEWVPAEDHFLHGETAHVGNGGPGGHGRDS